MPDFDYPEPPTEPDPEREDAPEDSGDDDEDLDDEALTAAHLAVENVLIEMRDARIGVLNRGNGFVVREYNGDMSTVMRLGTREGLRIGIKAYLKAVGGS